MKIILENIETVSDKLLISMALPWKCRSFYRLFEIAGFKKD
jgi:hypothetical protein